MFVPFQTGTIYIKQEYSMVTLVNGDVMNIEMISVNEVKNYIDKDGIQFIDLRDVEEYNQKHIKGSMNIPYNEFEGVYQKLPKDKIYILYCARGGISLLGARTMQQSGYCVKSLTGGTHAFSKKNIE